MRTETAGPSEGAGHSHASTAAVRFEAGDVPGLALQTLDGRWVQVHGRREPNAEADRLVAAAFEVGEPEALIVIAPGLGYVLDAIGRRSPRTRILAIEPFPAVGEALLRQPKWQDWTASGRLTVLVGPDYRGAVDAWRVVDGPGRHLPVIVGPVCAREFPAETAAARRLAERLVFGARSNANARKNFAGRYLLNTLRNLSAISREADVASLIGAFGGVPAILVAAGPSLDQNSADLQGGADGAVVIAVDTALRSLLRAGIRPHLVVAVDPSEENGRHLRDLPPVSGSWLVAEPSVVPEAFATFENHSFLFAVADHHPWPWLQQHGIGVGSLRAWGSVLTSALDLALRLGCDPITFVGADLAYTGGQPYCRGTVFEEDWAPAASGNGRLEQVWRQQLQARQTIQALDLRGEHVLTTEALVEFRDWLLETMRMHGTRRFLNATGAGLLHGDPIRQVGGVRDGIAIAGARRADIAQRLSEAHAGSTSRAVPVRALARRILARHWDGTLSTLVPLGAFRTFLDDEQALIRALVTTAHAAADDGAPKGRSPLASEVADAFEAAVAQPVDYNRQLDIEPDQELVASFHAASHESLPSLIAETPHARHRLEPDHIQPEAGKCWVFRFRTHGARLFTHMEGFARATMFEDGRPLPWANVLHDEIRSEGEGRYSAWPGGLYFSTPDGSDPRHNGRAYEIEVPGYVHFLERLPDSVVRKLGL